MSLMMCFADISIFLGAVVLRVMYRSKFGRNNGDLKTTLMMLKATAVSADSTFSSGTPRRTAPGRQGTEFDKNQNCPL